MPNTATKQQKGNSGSPDGESKSGSSTSIGSNPKQSQSQNTRGGGDLVQNIKGNYLKIPYQLSGEICEDKLVFEILCENPSGNKKLVHLADFSANNKMSPKVRLEAGHQPQALPTLVNFSNEIINDLKKYDVWKNIENRKFTLFACQTLIEDVIHKDISIYPLDLKNESLKKQRRKETKEEKEERQLAKDARYLREQKILATLTPEEETIIVSAFEIVLRKESRLLANSFKKLGSFKGQELSRKYDEPEISLELKSNSWCDVFNSPILNTKIYEAITGYLRPDNDNPTIPNFLVECLNALAKSIKDEETRSENKSSQSQAITTASV